MVGSLQIAFIYLSYAAFGGMELWWILLVYFGFDFVYFECSNLLMYIGSGTKIFTFDFFPLFHHCLALSGTS